MPILLHGDAAFAGQGVVAECFALSGLRGHKTGGTMHIVVNNQIGFTTAPHFSRSSPYPTDNALVVEARFSTSTAMIQRRLFTPPKSRPSSARSSTKTWSSTSFATAALVTTKGTSRCSPTRHVQKDQDAKDHAQPLYRAAGQGRADPRGRDRGYESAFQAHLNDEFEAGKDYKPNKADWLDGKWSHLDRVKDEYQRGRNRHCAETLAEVGAALTPRPMAFRCTKQWALLEPRRRCSKPAKGFDWATGEALAFGSIATEGYPRAPRPVRTATRGTFSQRHSGLINQDTEERYYPLNNIRAGQAHYEVIDSMLSEYAVLGFEYGYSMAEPNALTLWEAQFGDFANGAQIMFDQFISSGESKWLRMSGLVVLCLTASKAKDQSTRPPDLSVSCKCAVRTTGSWRTARRRPTTSTSCAASCTALPQAADLDDAKVLLRHKMAVSKAEEFTTGSSFHRVLWDDANTAIRTRNWCRRQDQTRRDVFGQGLL